MGHCALMAPRLTSTLCTTCGLCCDGTLFADVELGPAEAARLEIMGLRIDEEDTDAGLLSQPCAALKGTSCGIYAHRPRCCRIFECRLLQDAQNGAITVERAATRIADTRRQVAEIRDLLLRLGNRDRRLPLKERCAEVLARKGRATPATVRAHAELEARMARLERTIWNLFLGDGRRR